MGHRNYFHTWTNQNNPKTIDLKKTFEWGYITKDNEKIYDLSSGSYHQSFGLQNDRLKDAIKAQLEDIAAVIPKAEFDLKDKVSKAFIERIGLKGRIFYTLSGAESNENAMKIVRQATKREVILSCENSYHGATIGPLALSGDWRRDGLGTQVSGHAFIPNFYNDPDLLKTQEIINDLGPNNIAAICLETITGGNGVYIPTDEYFLKLDKICKKHGIKIILDEVVCGFSRTGKDFGFQNYKIKPDLISFAKAISGGYFPFGATFVSEEIASYFDTEILSCGLTNAAHPIGLKVLEEVLNLTKEEEFKSLLLENIKTLTDFKEQLLKISNVKEIRNIGMLMAIELNEAKDMRDYWEKCLDKGLFLNTTRNMLILCPYLNFPNNELVTCLNILKEIIKND